MPTGGGLEELKRTALRAEHWALLAWADTRLRYRRTVLGPFWLTLTTALTLAVVGLVFGGIFDRLPGAPSKVAYLPYAASGLVLWTFLSNTLNESCTVFMQAARLIKSVEAPILLHVFRMLARQLISLAHNVPLIVLLWLGIGWPLRWPLLLLPLGLALMVIALLACAVSLGILCTRYRDMQQIVAALLPLFFLLTPIIWMPSSLQGTPALVLLHVNPLYYLIEVVRRPMLGEAGGILVWVVAAAIAGGMAALALRLYDRYRHRIVYWL